MLCPGLKRFFSPTIAHRATKSGVVPASSGPISATGASRSASAENTK